MHPFNPNGLFHLGSNAMMPAHRDEAVPLYPNAKLPTVFGDATMPCWRRRAAWINTAGSFDMTWCADARGRLIHRDAKQGSTYAWDADHVVPRAQGGSDLPDNLRALGSSSNRSQGARR
jgi:HNH endonuclease